MCITCFFSGIGVFISLFLHNTSAAQKIVRVFVLLFAIRKGSLLDKLYLEPINVKKHIKHYVILNASCFMCQSKSVLLTLLPTHVSPCLYEDRLPDGLIGNDPALEVYLVFLHHRGRAFDIHALAKIPVTLTSSDDRSGRVTILYSASVKVERNKLNAARTL